MANAITIPSLQINGIALPIVPNSLTYVRGVGTFSVKAQSIGKTTVAVFEKNQEEAISKLNFSVNSTKENIEFIEVLQDNSPNNIFQFTQEGFIKTIAQGAIKIDPVNELGADKTISIEVEGAPVV